MNLNPKMPASLTLHVSTALLHPFTIFVVKLKPQLFYTVCALAAKTAEAFGERKACSIRNVSCAIRMSAATHKPCTGLTSDSPGSRTGHVRADVNSRKALLVAVRRRD